MEPKWEPKSIKNLEMLIKNEVQKSMQKITSKKVGSEEARVNYTASELEPRRGVRGEVNLPPGGSEVRRIRRSEEMKNRRKEERKKARKDLHARPVGRRIPSGWLFRADGYQQNSNTPDKVGGFKLF